VSEPKNVGSANKMISPRLSHRDAKIEQRRAHALFADIREKSRQAELTAQRR
jgi:hypothetical protein